MHVLTQNHSALRTRSLRLLQLLSSVTVNVILPRQSSTQSQTHSHSLSLAMAIPSWRPAHGSQIPVEEPDSQAGRALGSNSSSSSSLLPAKRSCDPLPNVRDRLRLCLVIFIYFFRWATYSCEMRQVDYRRTVGN